MLLLSSATLGYLPPLMLQVIGVAYLLSLRNKSKPTWLFIGIQACLLAFTLTRALASGLFSISSFYLDWWGGTGFSALAYLGWLEFSYTFPRPRYQRERRIVLLMAVIFTLSLFAWMAWITFVHPARLLDPLTSAGLSPKDNLASYSSGEYLYRFVEINDTGFTSHNVFSVWVILVTLWVLIVWVRKWADATQSAGTLPGWRSMLKAFITPQDGVTRTCRNWAALTVVIFLPALASFLEPAAVLPAGSFSSLYLVILFALFMGYLYYAPETTTFLARMVGVSMLITLLVMGPVSSMAIQKRDEIFNQVRLLELVYIHSAIRNGHLTDFMINSPVIYIAKRDPNGLFSNHYEMLFSRTDQFTAESLAAWDARLRLGLENGDERLQAAAAREFPWLGFSGTKALMGHPGQINSTSLPENTLMYRGVSFPPEAQAIRYSFQLDGKRYEIGFSYMDYRKSLNIAIAPWLTALILVSFSLVALYYLFFHAGMLAPLQGLLVNINRVDDGDLSVRLRVNTQDEIGKLSEAFNRMVASLSSSKDHLQSMRHALEVQVAERTRDLTTLYDINALSNQARVSDELLQAGLEKIVSSLRVQAGIIWLPDPADNRLRLRAACQVPAPLAELLPAAPLWETLRSRQETLIIHDFATSPRRYELIPPGLGHQDIFPYASLISVPLPMENLTKGLLVLFGTTSFFFKTEDLELLEAVARQLSLAIENIQLREQVAVSAAMEERQRLARDLHDSVTQLLYSQVLFSDAAMKSMRSGQDEKTSHYISRLGYSAHYALREMRLLLYRLLPFSLAQMGLAGSLQRRLELVEQRAGMKTNFACTLSLPLLPNVEQTLYFIAEEALNNVIKHAGADTVWIKIIQIYDAVEMTVVDNGKGFEPGSVSRGMGLQNMQERTRLLDGTLMIQPRAEGGTQLSVRLPNSFENAVKSASEETSHER